jgi:DNA-binding PadR family transcriptional regulator
MILNAFTSFIEFHILHHASEEAIYGLWLIEELAEHGYKISPGTLYPLLHSMESSGLIKSRDVLHNGKIRKYYSITPKGKRHLQKAKQQVGELVREVFSADDYQRFLAPNPLKAQSKKRIKAS